MPPRAPHGNNHPSATHRPQHHSAPQQRHATPPPPHHQPQPQPYSDQQPPHQPETYPSPSPAPQQPYTQPGYQQQGYPASQPPQGGYGNYAYNQPSNQPHPGAMEAQHPAYWGPQQPRPNNRQAPVFSEEALRLHEESKKLFPELNLSKGEFVIKVIRRNPIGLISIWFGVAVIVLVSFVILGFILFTQGVAGLPVLLVVGLIAFLVSGIAAGGAMIASYVYKKNMLFITNESIIQRHQKSIFTHHEQTISLRKVEDASYRKTGIIEHLFGFGSLRLSTVGEENSYRFSYVDKPKEVIDFINNAVEAYSRGWPMIDMLDRSSFKKQKPPKKSKITTALPENPETPPSQPPENRR